MNTADVREGWASVIRLVLLNISSICSLYSPISLMNLLVEHWVDNITVLVQSEAAAITRSATAPLIDSYLGCHFLLGRRCFVKVNPIRGS